jgi:hypothetical protein
VKKVIELTKLFGFLPDMDPIKMDKVMEIIVDKIVSSRDAGKKAMISCMTGRFVTSDSPRSPLRAFVSQIKYCTGIGSFRCNFSLS